MFVLRNPHVTSIDERPNSSVASSDSGGTRYLVTMRDEGGRGDDEWTTVAEREIDLHGQHADDAVRLLQDHIIPACIRDRVRRLRIIVGVGDVAGRKKNGMRQQVLAYLSAQAAAGTASSRVRSVEAREAAYIVVFK